LPVTKVYVADAHSSDGTPGIALSFAHRLPVEVIVGGLPSVGRNAGALLAQTPYVLFMDADIELRDPTLLRRAMHAMHHRKLHCLTTNIACPDGTATDRLLFALNNLVQQGSRWVSPFATGMFMLFDKQEFDRLGGFNERALYAEDYLLSKQVARRRFAVISGSIATSNRRFRKMGHAHVAGMFLRTAFNMGNPDYFLQDQGYWDEPRPTGISFRK
jgi:glycosyltransferase involved in cell wall biosynthesis